MKEMWNKRYSEEKNIYGLEPNKFFKEELLKLEPGKLLLPGDGEGRNALFAAINSWEVHAFDYSEEAVKNACTLIQNHNVKANVFQADILNLPIFNEKFSVVACMYLHLPSKDRRKAHQIMLDSIETGGVLIMEIFSKKQLGRSSGGPQNEDMLYNISEIQQDFSELEILYLKEEEVELNEGDYHQGKAMVIRFVGRKKLK